MFFDEITKRESCGDQSLSDGGDDQMTLLAIRISSVFVVLAGSGLGVFFPIVASKSTAVRIPKNVFFFCKYFGSGVILATAFIHLLYEANLNLTSDCLSDGWHVYPYAFAIMLFSLFTLFLGEILTFRFVENKLAMLGKHSHSHFGDESAYVEGMGPSAEEIIENVNVPQGIDEEKGANKKMANDAESDEALVKSTSLKTLLEKYQIHFGDEENHSDKQESDSSTESTQEEKYFSQLVSIFVLEFGVLFHSVFVGLTLGITTSAFTTLYIVIIFHQLFEGLGLGARIASTTWPKNKRWIPWVFGAGFTLVTPIGIAVGLGVSQTYPSDSPRALITNGIFDSVSAGILIYSGVVELMAHEFIFSNEFDGAGGTKRMLFAFGSMCLGCGLMSLLGKWA